LTRGAGRPAPTPLGGLTFPRGCDPKTHPTNTHPYGQASLKIKLNDPKYDPPKQVLVKINGKQVALVKGIKRLQKSITLKKLPSGTYKISVVATTVLKQHLSGSQT
jgi:hypothetical protein